MLFHLKNVFFIFILVNELFIFQVICQIRLKEEPIKTFLHQVNVSHNDDEVEDISKVVNIDNDIIIFEPDIFKGEIDISQEGNKNDIIIESKVHSFYQNKLSFECLPIKMFTCITEDNKNNDGYNFKIIANKDYKEYKNITYLDVKIFLHDFNGITKEYKRGKNIITFAHNISNNVTINDKQDKRDILLKNSILFDQPIYNVMLFSGPTKKSIISRGKITLQRSDKTLPQIWIENQSNGNIFDIENIKYEKDGIYSFDIIIKNNIIVKEKYDKNTTITGTIKAKQSNIEGVGKIIAEIIPQSTSKKSKKKNYENITLTSDGEIYKSIEDIKVINFTENIDDILIPFKNLNINDEEVSRISINNKHNSYFKDNDEVIFNNVLQLKNTNLDIINKEKNVTNNLDDKILEGKKFVLFSNINRSHVKDEKNNYKQNIINGEKIYKIESKKSTIDNSILHNNNNSKLVKLENIEEVKNDTSKFVYNFNILENSANETIIGELMILNNLNNEDISIIMFNETKDYLFKIIDNKLIVICQNKQQHCIDYEEDKEILLLLLNKENNPILVNINITNEDENDPKIVLYNKDIKISNDKMLNQFLFSVTDEDGIESNEILLTGDVSKHFTIQKAQDDGLYQIVFLSTPPTGRNELSIIIKGKEPSKRSIVKNIPVKVIDNIHKAHFRKDIYSIKISGKNIIKDEKIIHLELEGVSIDSVDFYVLEGNVGWIVVEKYGGDVKITSDNNTIYNGNYEIIIGAIDKESNKIVAKTTLAITIYDSFNLKSTFIKQFYPIRIENKQKSDIIDINLLPINSKKRINIDEESIFGLNEKVELINVSKNYISIYGNKVKVSLKDIFSIKSLYFKVYLDDNPSEKALVSIHIYTNEEDRQNEIKKYSKLRLSNRQPSDIISLNVDIPENTTVGKIIENIYSFNQLTGEGPTECLIENEYEKYFHVDITNGDILLIQQIDYDTLKNPQLEVPILCSQNKSNSINIILNVNVINVPDNSPIIKILNAKYPLIYEIDKTTSENYNLFNFTIIDIDGELEHSLEIIGEDSSKFDIEKNFDETYSFNTASNAIFNYGNSKTLKLILIVKDNENNVGKEVITINFTNKNNQLPYIEKKNYQFKVVQNWPENVYVGTLYINNNYYNNNNNTNVEFFIEDQPNDYFKIDKNNGRISTKKLLKNMTIDVPYEMRIIVLSKLNKNFKDNAIVTINTIDPDTIIKDDEKYLQIVKPKDGEVIKISETYGIKKEIYSVDILYKGDTLDLSNIKYNIINLNNKNDTTFIINENGKIILNLELNYEKISKYSFIIEVKNDQNDKEIDSVIIFIEVENENNNLPYFVEDYTNRLFTYNKSSIILGKVQAIDKDFEPYNKIYYHIIKHCGKNYNKLQIDMVTGEIRRGKYKAKNIKQYKKFPKYFEVCIFASQYNFTLKNSLIIFDKNRKDQVKIRIKYVEEEEDKKIENIVSNNYLYNNTVEDIPTQIDKLPIYYNEDKLNYHLHKHQHFSIQSFTLTPANYEPNAKILHINKNKRIFKINELSGDIIVNPKIISYPEGIYKVFFTLSDDENLNKTIVYKKNFHFIDKKNKMKFIFDTPVSKVGFRLNDFNEALESIMEELSKLNKYKTKIYLENNIKNEKNYKSSVCFHIADEDIVKDVFEYKIFFETLFSKFSKLNKVFDDYSVRNIIKCSENWEPYLKKGFIDKVTQEKDNKMSWKDYTITIIILIIILIATWIFLYYCIAMKYRFHLLIEKEHLRLITNKRVMAISMENEKQFVKNSPQFAIGMSPDLLEY
uniref:Cadherin domain-containing protein n=1 Tax=Strongyloides stercoralis TaxID=6248 RepID=A0A0K0ETP6_STRER